MYSIAKWNCTHWRVDLIKGNVYIFYSYAMTFFGNRLLITLFSFWDPNIFGLYQNFWMESSFFWNSNRSLDAIIVDFTFMRLSNKQIGEESSLFTNKNFPWFVVFDWILNRKYCLYAEAYSKTITSNSIAYSMQIMHLIFCHMISDRFLFETFSAEFKKDVWICLVDSVVRLVVHNNE